MGWEWLNRGIPRNGYTGTTANPAPTPTPPPAPSRRLATGFGVGFEGRSVEREAG